MQRICAELVRCASVAGAERRRRSRQPRTRLRAVSARPLIHVRDQIQTHSRQRGGSGANFNVPNVALEARELEAASPVHGLLNGEDRS